MVLIIISHKADKLFSQIYPAWRYRTISVFAHQQILFAALWAESYDIWKLCIGTLCRRIGTFLSWSWQIPFSSGQVFINRHPAFSGCLDDKPVCRKISIAWHGPFYLLYHTIAYIAISYQSIWAAWQAVLPGMLPEDMTGQNI